MSDEEAVDARPIIEQFHQVYTYFFSHTPRPRWLGQEVQKCPLDLWVYQEIIYDTLPDLIIECGTASGGSALFLAQVCEAIDHGQVITVDVSRFVYAPKHKRIKHMWGDTIHPDTVERIQERIKARDRVMVILDDDHTKDHVLEELRIYGEMVTPGCYLIVEDTNLNGHPVSVGYGPGPYEAVMEFLTETDRFIVDQDREKFMMTFNSNGYLQKVK